MIIYKTTNILNDKFYIGKDSKNNPEYIEQFLIHHGKLKGYRFELSK